MRYFEGTVKKIVLLFPLYYYLSKMNFKTSNLISEVRLFLLLIFVSFYFHLAFYSPEVFKNAKKLQSLSFLPNVVRFFLNIVKFASTVSFVYEFRNLSNQAPCIMV